MPGSVFWRITSARKVPLETSYEPSTRSFPLPGLSPLLLTDYDSKLLSRHFELIQKVSILVYSFGVGSDSETEARKTYKAFNTNVLKVLGLL